MYLCRELHPYCQFPAKLIAFYKTSHHSIIHYTFISSASGHVVKSVERYLPWLFMFCCCLYHTSDKTHTLGTAWLHVKRECQTFAEATLSQTSLHLTELADLLRLSGQHTKKAVTSDKHHCNFSDQDLQVHKQRKPEPFLSYLGEWPNLTRNKQ